MNGGIAPVADGPAGHGRDQLEVLGSAIDADPQELHGLARKLAAIADSLSGAAQQVARARLAIQGSTPWAPSSGRQAQSQCHLGELELLGAVRQARDLADSLHTAADAYSAAEAAAERAFVFELPRPPAMGWWGTLAFAPYTALRSLALASGAQLMTAARGQVTPTDPQFGYLLEEASWLATGGHLYPDWAPLAEDRTQLAGTLASIALTAGFTLPGGPSATGVAVHRQDPPDRSAAGPPVNTHGAAGIADLSTGIGDLYGGGRVPEGSIRIDRVTDADGQVFWQVYVPGTQTQTDEAASVLNPVSPATLLSAAGIALVNRNPFDWATNTQVYTGQENAVQNGVVQALTDAGVGPDEPVLLTGHSQGAMIAMAVADDPRVRSDYDVQSVVTFGGPVGHMETPEGVAVLHVEHRDDLVSGLENSPNPVEGGRVTVRRDLAASGLPVDAGVTSVTESHDMPAYTRTGVMIDRSGDPALDSWRVQSQRVLTHGDGAQVQSGYYTLVRDR
ncbi:hypothetical protein [Ruania zhangjianzhongii]|uniref:hypothetical protein n=1 Tax=Ruania zhangjianzhongii TaxID=2603206 RepID=UPI0011CA21E1|nr:hypothetical protein [Ruania zhangjianzhongii]